MASLMRTLLVPCPACLEDVPLNEHGLLDPHGMPPCSRSGRSPGRIWPTKHHGQHVRTIPGPDTWNPTTLEGAA